MVHCNKGPGYTSWSRIINGDTIKSCYTGNNKANVANKHREWRVSVAVVYSVYNAEPRTFIAKARKICR